MKQLAEKEREVSILVGIDGPYGISNVGDTLAKYDKTLLAGGSGAGLILPLMQSLLRTGKKAVEIRIMLEVRNYASVSWMRLKQF